MILKSGTSSKLFVSGATFGTAVTDCILTPQIAEYDFAPISIPAPAASESAVGMAASLSGASISSLSSTAATSYLFNSSWLVPPLLGMAYVILGSVLPRIITAALEALGGDKETFRTESTPSPKTRKALALSSLVITSLLVKLCEFCVTNRDVVAALPVLNSLPIPPDVALSTAAVVATWVALDGTLPSLLLGIATYFGGPLSELPFIAAGAWHYVPEFADSFPLEFVDPNGLVGRSLQFLLGQSYPDLAMCSISNPCYFAITLNAIALGRWFDATDEGT